nr:MAG TPA: holin [Caudoviricetes sp.]
MTFDTPDMWALSAILFFVVTDYITGIVKAIMAGNLSSSKMRAGLGHKFAYLILALVAYMIDAIGIHVDLGLPVHVFLITVGGICLIELTSILENVTQINPELKNAPFMQIFADTDSREGR